MLVTSMIIFIIFNYIMKSHFRNKIIKCFYANYILLKIQAIILCNNDIKWIKYKIVTKIYWLINKKSYMIILLNII
jgi:hypothetical protein